MRYFGEFKCLTPLRNYGYQVEKIIKHFIDIACI
jgi:hypothetical protein